MQNDEKHEQQKSIDREKLADKVLDIFSDSPEDMSALVDLLKKLENNPVLHPENAKTEAPQDKGGDKKQDQ